MNPLARYVRWLHLKWPAGRVEKLPLVHADGSTNVPGLYIVGDLTGIPLLKFSSDTGARVVRLIHARGNASDVIIIGAGVSGMAAALEARKLGLRVQVLESSEPFATVVNFPARKPIYTYPSDMTPAGELQFRNEVHPKEQLLDDLRRETAGITPRRAAVESVTRAGDELQVNLAAEAPLRAKYVIVAIGRSGNFRKLDVPGEDLDKVYNRLHDPKDFAGRKVLVVGGGDSALETAIAIAEVGGDVTISYRGAEFARPKHDNVQRLATLPIRVLFNTRVVEVHNDGVVLRGLGVPPEHSGASRSAAMLGRDAQATSQATLTIPNDAVLTMIGREAPLDFLRKSGVKIRGEWSVPSIVGLIAFVLFCFWLYHWKSGHAIPFVGGLPASLNFDPTHVGTWFTDRTTLMGTIAHAASGRSFYYTLAYSTIIVVFGIRRIRRRRTPYVTWQTLTLMAIQVVPLFILPEILLPYLGSNGVFDHGAGLWIKTTFFPGESWWRAYGLVLAWPLFVYNWFTAEPIWGWLVLGFLQTFVAIPAMVYFWGKGAYCGWICSCGALAETLGDTHRHKMPHGPAWNRLNLAGQIILAFVGVLMILRILGWMLGSGSLPARLFHTGFDGPLGYGWTVDLLLAGVIGYGLYFWFSGRVWCRFFCPLAALMHIYARIGRFRILADKKKCISCNVCTSVCHQGIDVMSFANKGEPMADPQCVRCSACVQMCPTGVLSFGQVDPRTNATIKTDPAWLAASPVLMREIGVKGRPVQV